MSRTPAFAAAAVSALLLIAPTPVEAYIGPGAGFVLVPSLLGILMAAAAAVLWIISWPFRLVWRRIRGTPRDAPTTGTSLLARVAGQGLRLALRGARPIVLAMAAVSVCHGDALKGSASQARVIVLGFDGMDYAVTRDLMARGRMPNVAALAASGTFAPLESSTPAQSPVAWSSFITGLNPGGHGIFDFIHRDPDTMTPYLSTTRTEPAEHHVTIGSWQLPVSRARVTLLRDGQPFWEVLEQQGIRTTIMRVPANFPPSGRATRELSGMGTPDILGTYGTFSFFTSEAGTHPSGGRVVRVDVVDGVVRAEIAGPPNPFRTPARAISVPLTVYLDPREPAARIVVGSEARALKVGEWSDWVPVAFRLMPLQTLRGMCRVYLKQVRPTFELYVSPVNLDPAMPAMPISTPASFAAELARTTGRFHTQGIAEDTRSVIDGVLTRDEFLEQAAAVADEHTRQYRSLLDSFTGGLLFYHFGTLDQVSHMMWRARDPGHPAYDPARDGAYRDVVDDLYVAFDRLVGETMQRMGPDTTLIVMSDHGFASWRRSFHLNNWLRDNGYLTVIDPDAETDAGLFQNIDWSRTRAYGVGLNGLYINLRGRERWGIVPETGRAELVEDLRARLLGTIDPATRRGVVADVSPREAIYSDARHFDVAPDLIIGYAEGTRVSNESALGGAAGSVFADNRSEWSGDHCMDHRAVPGIVLTSRPLRRPAVALDEIAGAILAEFGIEGR